MSLFFATIGATNPWPPFKLCSVWERNSGLRLTGVFEARWTWLKLPIMGDTTYWGWLKQPYKHYLASSPLSPEDPVRTADWPNKYFAIIKPVAENESRSRMLARLSLRDRA